MAIAHSSDSHFPSVDGHFTPTQWPLPSEQWPLLGWEIAIVELRNGHCRNGNGHLFLKNIGFLRWIFTVKTEGAAQRYDCSKLSYRFWQRLAVRCFLSVVKCIVPMWLSGAPMANGKARTAWVDNIRLQATARFKPFGHLTIQIFRQCVPYCYIVPWPKPWPMKKRYFPAFCLLTLHVLAAASNPVFGGPLCSVGALPPLVVTASVSQDSCR